MKNRDILTLLKVMRDNIGLCKYSLCYLAIDLHDLEIISFKENCKIDDFMSINAPAPNEFYPYWFKKGDILPRLDWLNQQIAKEEKRPLNRLKSLGRWFLSGSDNNPIPGWAFVVVFVVMVATVYMLVDTVIDLVVYYNF
jgi:hypothetical protein